MNSFIFEGPKDKECTLVNHFNQIYQLEDKRLCLFCANICNKSNELLQTEKILCENQKLECECDHKENELFFNSNLKYFFSDSFNTLNGDEIKIMNRFLLFEKNNLNIWSLSNPNAYSTLNLIKNDLENNTFKWSNYELESLDNLNEFLSIFYSKLKEIDTKSFFFLDTVKLEELFPLKFIENITDYPYFFLEDPIYEKILTFFSLILHFLIEYYIKKDFFLLECFEVEEMETSTVFARERIRKKNKENPYIKHRYFSSFKLCPFAIKLVNNFLIGSNNLWISKKTHRVHFYSILMCKLLAKFGLLSESELESIQNILYQKRMNLVVLEKNINLNLDSISDELFNFIIKDCIRIRDYYGEILLNLTFIKQDKEIINIINKISKIPENERKKGEIEKLISFDDNFMFKREYARKSIDFLRFMISSEKIKGLSLISKRSQSLTRNFMYFFATNNDSYLKSLKLMNEEELNHFLINFNKHSKYEKQLEDFFINFQELSKNELNWNEAKFFKDLEDLLKIVTNILNLKDKPDIIKQEIMNSENLGVFIQSFIRIFVKELKKNNKENLFLTMINILEYYLLNNTDNQSSFFKESIFETFLNKVFKEFPNETINFLNKIIKSVPIVFIFKSYCLEKILCYFDEILLKENLTINDYESLNKIIEISHLTINKKFMNLFVEVPASDLIISKHFSKLVEKFSFENIEKALKASQLNDDNKIEYEFMVNSLDLISKSLQFRFNKQIYEIYSQYISFEQIKTFNKNFKVLIIFLNFVEYLYIDFEENLIDSNEEIEIDYKTIIIYLIENLQLINKDNEILENYTIFANKLYRVIYKLVNYILNLTDIKIAYFVQYIEVLTELIVLIRKTDYFSDFKWTYESDSPQQKNSINNLIKGFSIEIASVQKKSEKNQLKLRKICKEIYEISKKLSQIIKKNKVKIVENSKMKIEKWLSTVDMKSGISNIQKTTLDFSISGSILLKYEKYKIMMTSTNNKAQNNPYFVILNSEEMNKKEICKNLVLFCLNQLTQSNWVFERKKMIYKILKCISNIFFNCTSQMQNNLKIILKEDESFEGVMENIWVQMKKIIYFIHKKKNINHILFENYEHCLIIIKWHQFLVEDNNKHFKKWFRERKLQGNTNRIKDLMSIFNHLCVYLNWDSHYIQDKLEEFKIFNKPYLFKLGIFIVECLTELINGPNQENQREIYDLCSDKIKGILCRYCNDVNSDFYNLKNVLVQYLFTMIDRCDERIYFFIATNYELNTINKIIIDSMKQLYFEFDNNDKSVHSINEYSLKMSDYQNMLLKYSQSKHFYNHPLIDICFAFHFNIRITAHKDTKYDLFCEDRRKSLESHAKTGKILIKSVNEEDLVCYKFLVNMTKKVELSGDELKIFKFYFKSSPKSIYLSKESKNRFVNIEANRESYDSKLISLLNYVPYFEMEMNENSKNFKNRKYLFDFFISQLTFYYVEIFILFISFIINILILFDFTNRDVPYYIYQGDYYPLILGLSITEIIISIGATIVWVLLKHSMTYKIILKKTLDRENLSNESELSRIKIFSERFLSSILHQNAVGSYLYHILFVFLGLTFSSGFFGFDLLTIINLSQTLQYVIKSVTAHYGQLLWTFALGILIMYTYSIFTFAYFFQDFGEDNQFCNSLAHCFTQIITTGFRNGQGVGDMMINEPFDSNNWREFYGQMFLTISFFMVVNIILMNIIFGVIVDTFGELRDKMEEFNFDKRNICFMCGIEKYEFEKNRIDFYFHTNNEHNLWDYVDFIIYINNKSLKDCNGVEYGIKRKINEGKLEWLPIKSAVCLGGSQEKEDNNKEEINCIKESIGVLKNQYIEINKKLDLILNNK